MSRHRLFTGALLILALSLIAPSAWASPLSASAPGALDQAAAEGSYTARVAKRGRRAKKGKSAQVGRKARRARAARAAKRGARSSRPARPETSSAPLPEPAPIVTTRRAPARVDFDDRLIQGQTNKSGAIYIFERKSSELHSMVRRRTSFRDEILRTIE